MSSPDPSPRSPDALENPHVRLFLERASAVVAQCGGVNAKSRILLGKLAEELGLSRAEAEPAIRTLLLAHEDFGPHKRSGRSAPVRLPPKPPPLPRGKTMEVEASLVAEPPVVVIDDNTVLQNFTDKAALVLSQHGGWNPKSRVILEELARAMGVTPREMEAALASLREAADGVQVYAEPASQPPLPPPIPGEAEAGHESPAPPGSSSAPFAPPLVGPPPPPKPRPQEVFRAYLHKAIDDLKRPRINARRERRLIEQGVHKLGLSPVLSLHILCEVAQERNVLVESKEAGAAAPQEHDPRIAEFLARARAVIAEQRGVTVAGQIKLTAAARELGLSDEEHRRAMDLLQDGAAPQTAEAARRQELLAAFRESLEPAIEALPRKIITPDIVSDLVERGVERFGVSCEEAERAVRDVAAACGVRYVSQQRAVEHLARLVGERMGGSAVLHAADRQRIFAEGAQWGLGTADIEAIVVEQIEINRQAQAVRRRRTAIVTGVLSAAAIAVLCVGGAWLLLRDAKRDAAAVSQVGESDATGYAGSGAEAAPPPSDHWWDVDLSVAMARAETELPHLKPALAQVRSHDPDQRIAAYTQLVDGVPRVMESRTASAVLKEILSGCYALEPSDVAAAHLRERLLAALPPADAPLPEDEQPFREAYAAAQVAVAVLTRESGPPARKDDMQRSLELAVGLTVDPAWEDVELYRQCMAALTQTLYHIVIAAAPSQPLALQPIYALVASEANRFLDPIEFARLDARFLRALLPVAENVWRDYQEAILRVINSADPATVLQAVDLLERANDDSLRFYVKTGLMRRIGMPSESQSAEDVVAAVRERFGARAAPADRAEDVQRRFAREAEETLLRASAGADQPQKLLEETANLARVSAMGSALAQGELGRSAFDQLAAIESLSLEKHAAEAASRPDASSVTSSPRERVIGRYIDSLSRANHPVQRVGYLRGVVENATPASEITPQEGEALAKYLLAPKANEERDAIAGFLPQVGRWKLVRLAMADLIVQSPVRQDLVTGVVGGVLGREPELSADGDWRKELRTLLMRSVLERGPATTSQHPYDVAQATILEMYQAQARMRGVPNEAYADAASPAAVVRALVEHQAARSGEVKGEQNRRFLAGLPHELQAIDYLADNDLRRLVLLERLWLRLLAMEVAAARPDRAAEAATLVETLLATDRKAPNALVQARDGQAAILRLWRLRGE